MKKIFFTLIIFTVLSSLTVYLVYATEKSEKSIVAMEQTILRFLSDSADDAIKEYYGEPRQYWEDKIISVQKVSGTPYEVVMQVETFYGPHNPPYGLETMIFHIDYGEIKLIKFEHQDECI